MRTPFKIFAGLAALALAAGPVGASAQTTAGGVQRLDDAELGLLRGGYLTAGGVVFDFGAVVRTYVDGRLALESRLTWTGAGALTEHHAIDGGPITAIDNLGAVDLSGLDGREGLLLTGTDGTTALIHDFGGGRIQNLVINSADGRDLRQEIEINLALPQLDVMQSAGEINRLGAAISQDLDAAIVRSVGGF